MSEISNFDAVIESAANAMASGLRTSIKFIDTNGSHKDVHKYVGNRYHPITAGQGPLVMGSAHVTSNPVATMHYGYNNAGTGVGHMAHTFAKSWTDTLTVSITAGISSTLTASMNASVGLPENIASLGGGIETSVTVSLEESLAVSKSVTTELSLEGSYDVPEHTYADMSWVVNLDKCVVPFSQRVTISGQVAIWFEHKREIQPGGGNHYLWFIPIPTLLGHGGQLPEGYSYAGGDAVAYTVRGELDGSIGAAGDITTTTRPAVASLPSGGVDADTARRLAAAQSVPADEHEPA